jgi:diguanylate cyclase (GGDEF)-like protein
MLEQLRNKLKLAGNFPSPPAVAQQIIELASDPEIDVAKVAKAMSRDPALTAKIMRIANSPLYSKQRKSENLRQALVVLGLNAATTLALSFSLVGTYKTGKSSRIDYSRYWRRAILGASAARTFAELKHIDALEDVFLASLLQDIAVLAIDRVQPDFYTGLAAHANHDQLTAHEMHRLGTDHAALSAWLLRFWKLPEPLCQTVEWSHTPTLADAHTRAGLGARCLALGSDCAEMLLGDRTALKLSDLSVNAGSWLGISADSVGEAMEKIVAHLPETERLFDAALLDQDSCAAILEQARELLLIRNLQNIEQVGTLQRMTEHFEARTAELENKHRRDSLTGVYNRGHLDYVMDAEFRGAVTGGWPLSVLFADLDRFKQINDTYGHPAGDAVLIATANVILEVVRDTDCVARYGGEEFVIILPGLGADGALKIGERIVARLQSARHEVAGGTVLATASVGLATHHSAAPFESAAQLLEAADRAVYAAKRQGRNRLVCYDAGVIPAMGPAMGRAADAAAPGEDLEEVANDTDAVVV